MQDAFGGVANIVLIALFLIIAEGILGMAVNYTKAFKMKNLVISNFERYETAGCFNTSGSCYQAITDGAKRLGYSPSNLTCPQNTSDLEYHLMAGVYCYAKITPSNEKLNENKKASYRIVTQVDFHLPIISQMFQWEAFQVKGDTRIISIEKR